VKNAAALDRTVYPVPEEIDQRIAQLKLKAMGIDVDELTPEQAHYLSSWQEGT
jgi:adenosylhomocysteinase